MSLSKRYISLVLLVLFHVVLGAPAKTTTTTANNTWDNGDPDVTKDVIIPISISDATVKNITITNPNTTRFYTDSKYDENDYVEGLTITADYSDGSSKVIQGTDAVKGYVRAESTELDTTKAGKYVYVVEYNGAKATYELEVVEPTVKSLEVTTYPTTTTSSSTLSLSSCVLILLDALTVFS